MYKPTIRQSGDLRVTLRVRFDLSLDELTQAAALHFPLNLPTSMAQLAEGIADELSYNGRSGERFWDNVNEEESNHEYDLAQRYNALLRSVAKVYGFPEPTADMYLKASDDDGE
jgi:hypothetical protein